MAKALMAHTVMARLKTSLDGKNPEPFLMAPASTARNANTIFYDKPTSDTSSDTSSSSTRAASTSTIKREEKERSPGTAITGRRQIVWSYGCRVHGRFTSVVAQFFRWYAEL